MGLQFLEYHSYWARIFVEQHAGSLRGDLVIREKTKIAKDGESSLDDAFAKAIRQVVEM